jgi:diphthamide synthase subunit DPH2
MRILFFLLVFCCYSACAFADLTLADKWRAYAIIYIGANPPTHAEQAAELQTYLFRISGATLEIV